MALLMDRINQHWRMLLVCLPLAAATLATFWPVVHHDFLDYDDPDYVSENSHLTAGLTWENVEWAFTTRYASNWHPLTWLSHITDVQLFGLNPGWHHLTNLLLHTANSLLLLLLLKRLSRAFWRSAFVAALFALHPLHVESVAWVAERKDVLSAFFFMLTLLAYVEYTRAKTAVNPPILHPPLSFYYGLALLLVACGLMSKPMLVTVPFVLLLLDYWPLRRVDLPVQSSEFKVQCSKFWPLVWEKLPFFGLSLASCLVTLVAQNEVVSAAAVLPFAVRLQNAVLAYTAYLAQTLWPTHLAIFYPYPTDLPSTAVAGSAALLLLLTAVALGLAQRQPCVLVGWLWFLGMLVPVIGLVQVGSQARADRYTYLPLIGIFIAVTWGLASVLERGDGSTATEAGRQNSEAGSQGARHSTTPPLRRLAFLATGAVLVALALTTHRQVQYWSNSETVFTHAVQVTQGNSLAWECLGIDALKRGNPTAAMGHLVLALECATSAASSNAVHYYMGATLQVQGRTREALPYLEQAAVEPALQPQRNYRLGLSLSEVGRLPEAEAALQRALDAQPCAPEFQLGLAALRQRQGRTAEAEQLARAVAASHPEMMEAQRLLAHFLLLSGRPAEAEPHYAAALKLKPGDCNLRRAYANALAKQGKAEQAARQLEVALNLDPADVQANFELAQLLSEQGKTREAAPLYDKALDGDPEFVGSLNNLAWLLATDADGRLRNGPRAVELAERACKLTEWKTAFLMGTLAAAYAEAGRFSDAAAMAEKARDQARADKLEDVAKKNEELLKLYRAGKPYHQQK